MDRRMDVTGERYGKLVALYYTGKNKNKRSMWMFKCDCGNTKELPISPVKFGSISSCGCLLKKHGDSNTRLYHIWSCMRARCKNDGRETQKNYGKRGISVCDEWNDYKVFKSWALSHGYADDLSIDRIDVNGNYEPDNCRWATDKEQARNTRSNHNFTINGETKTMAEWCEIYQINKSSVRGRLKKGFSVEDAFTKPKRNR